ncbi:MAG: hypothetical protein ACP5D2_01990 [Candidatus Nanoarchaeia archaeon]
MGKAEDILNKYGAKIERQLSGNRQENYSKSYQEFREAMTPYFSRYEKWCKAFGNFFTIKLAEKDRKKINRQIEIAHLDLNASEVVVFALSCLLGVLFIGALFMTGVWFLAGWFSFMLAFLLLVFALFLFYYTYKIPDRLALQWRLKASSQMVSAILYIVVYMKHTANLEKAISFAANHLEEPLGLDFRKIFWDVQVGKFSTIKESLDHYLEGWRDYSLEFIESFHLIESSLYETDESRRVEVLEKSLQVVLDGIYDKMLNYTHDVKSPLTNVYMLGIVLPTLALAILPLASTMLGGALKAYHIFILFNIITPFLVLYLTNNVMMSRPGGYGETSLLEKNPLYGKFKAKKPYVIAGLVVLPLLLIGLLPVFWAYTGLPASLGMQKEYAFSEVGLGFLGDGGLFGIMMQDGKLIAGPHGPLSLLLSLFVPLSIAFFFIIAYRMKSKDLISSRKRYKEVENEFTSSLFQLGNRMGDGLPAEIAFSKVAENTKGTATEGFFKTVNQNIHQLGMSLEDALFNEKRGAVIFYPSKLIATSMKILLESVKKGLKVAARSLMSISQYVKNIKKINDRLNDLLADIISDMKSNMTFLAPLLSGIVVGLAGMITSILDSLTNLFNKGSLGAEDIAGAGGINQILSIFDITQMMSTYWLQIIIGVYLIEVIFILSSTLVTIKSGRDELQRRVEIASNLKISMLLYVVVALLAIVGLTLIGGVALSNLG